MPSYFRRTYLLFPLLFVGLMVAAHASDHATYIRPLVKTVPAASVHQIVLENLVGPVSVQTMPGDSISVVVLVHSAGADATFARALSQQLSFSIKNINGQLRIIGEYPLDHFRNYGYPKMKSIIGIHGTDSNVYQGKKVFIRNAGSGKAVVLWAEIRLKVPADIAVVIRNTYGKLTLHGGDPVAGAAAMDAFTDVGDIDVVRPQWSSLKLQNDYGSVKFTNGLGSSRDIHIKTDVGGTYLALLPDADPVIVAHKDLGFLHNDVTNASFTKDAQGDSVLKMGDGKGPTITINMSVGSLHLAKAGQS